MSDIFAIATRKKLRFPAVGRLAGLLSVEDVWDLPLKAKRDGDASLNELALLLDAEVAKQPRKSFVDDETTDTVVTGDSLRLEIVLAIIAVKKEEAKVKESAVVRAGQIQQLDQLITQKQNEALAGKSIEELQAMRAAL
jgi:hypothetical protein